MTADDTGELWVPPDLEVEVLAEPNPLTGTPAPTIFHSSNLTRFDPFAAGRAASTPLKKYQYMVSMSMTSHGTKRLPKVGAPPPSSPSMTPRRV